MLWTFGQTLIILDIRYYRNIIVRALSTFFNTIHNSF